MRRAITYAILLPLATLRAAGGTVIFDFETEAERRAVSHEAQPGCRVAAEDGFATSGRHAVRFTCAPWRTGFAEWPYFMLEPAVADWRGYDRLAIDIVSLDRGGARLQLNIAGPEGRAHKGFSRSAVVEDVGVTQWVVSLDDWPAHVAPENITRLQFVAQRRTVGFDVAIDRLTLLRKGEKAEAPRLPRLARKLLDALAERRDGSAAEEAALPQWRRHMSDFLRFRRACAADGALHAPDMLLGCASAMEHVMPRGAFAAAALPREGIGVRLARNEYESVQILVAPRDGALRDVQIRPEGDLVRTDGCAGVAFPATNITCDVTGYVRTVRPPPYRVGCTVATNAAPGYVRVTRPAETGWYPDPILPFLHTVDIAPFDVQSLWVRVRCPADQPAGTYAGALVLTARDASCVRIPFTVRVNGFTLGRMSELPLAVTFHPWVNRQEETARNLRRADEIARDPDAPVQAWKRHKAEWVSFLADYLIPYDELYHEGKLADLEAVRRLGTDGRTGLVNLGYWEHSGRAGNRDAWRARTLPRLRENYAYAQANGLLARAYVYGCDETEEDYFPAIRGDIAELKAALPGVPVFTTARDGNYGVGTALDGMDWFCPLTEDYDPVKAAAARAAGHKVWWYVCCYPHAPYANLFVECSPIETRLLMGAQAVRFKPDGFLYYQIANWNSRRCIATGPFTDWEARSWTVYNGDGAWVCAGPDGTPVPTVRLENFRDGLEDYAYAQILARRAAEVSSGLRKVSGDTETWLARAQELLSVPRALVDTLSNFTDNPRAVRRWRDAMADLIDAAD